MGDPSNLRRRTLRYGKPLKIVRPQGCTIISIARVPEKVQKEKELPILKWWLSSKVGKRIFRELMERVKNSTVDSAKRDTIQRAIDDIATLKSGEWGKTLAKDGLLDVILLKHKMLVTAVHGVSTFDEVMHSALEDAVSTVYDQFEYVGARYMVDFLDAALPEFADICRSLAREREREGERERERGREGEGREREREREAMSLDFVFTERSKLIETTKEKILIGSSDQKLDDSMQLVKTLKYFSHIHGVTIEGLPPLLLLRLGREAYECKSTTDADKVVTVFEHWQAILGSDLFANSGPFANAAGSTTSPEVPRLTRLREVLDKNAAATTTITIVLKGKVDTAADLPFTWEDVLHCIPRESHVPISSEVWQRILALDSTVVVPQFDAAVGAREVVANLLNDPSYKASVEVQMCAKVLPVLRTIGDWEHSLSDVSLSDDTFLRNFSRAASEIACVKKIGGDLQGLTDILTPRLDVWMDRASLKVFEKVDVLEKKAVSVCTEVDKCCAAVGEFDQGLLEEPAMTNFINFEGRSAVLAGLKEMNALVKQADAFITAMEGCLTVDGLKTCLGNLKQSRQNGRKIITYRTGLVILKGKLQSDVESFFVEAKKAKVTIPAWFSKPLKALSE